MRHPLKLQQISGKVAISGGYFTGQQQDSSVINAVHGFTVNKESIVMMAEVLPAQDYVKAINLTFAQFYIELHFSEQGMDEYTRVINELELDTDSIVPRFEHITVNVR